MQWHRFKPGHSALSSCARWRVLLTQSAGSKCSRCAQLFRTNGNGQNLFRRLFSTLTLGENVAAVPTERRVCDVVAELHATHANRRISRGWPLSYSRGQSHSYNYVAAWSRALSTGAGHRDELNDAELEGQASSQMKHTSDIRLAKGKRLQRQLQDEGERTGQHTTKAMRQHYRQQQGKGLFGDAESISPIQATAVMSSGFDDMEDVDETHLSGVLDHTDSIWEHLLSTVGVEDLEKDRTQRHTMLVSLAQDKGASSIDVLAEAGFSIDRTLIHEVIDCLVEVDDPHSAATILTALAQYEQKPWTGARRLYTNVIQRLCQRGEPQRAAALVYDLNKVNISINAHSFRYILAGFAELADPTQAKLFFDAMVERDVPVSRGVYRAYIDAHLQAGDMDTAQRVVSDLVNSGAVGVADPVSLWWEMTNRVFRGYLHHGQVSAALDFIASQASAWHTMPPFSLDDTSCHAVLQAAQAGTLSHKQSLHMLQTYLWKADTQLQAPCHQSTTAVLVACSLLNTFTGASPATVQQDATAACVIEATQALTHALHTHSTLHRSFQTDLVTIVTDVHLNALRYWVRHGALEHALASLKSVFSLTDTLTQAQSAHLHKTLNMVSDYIEPTHPIYNLLGVKQLATLGLERDTIMSNDQATHPAQLEPNQLRHLASGLLLQYQTLTAPLQTVSAVGGVMQACVEKGDLAAMFDVCTTVKVAGIQLSPAHLRTLVKAVKSPKELLRLFQRITAHVPSDNFTNDELMYVLRILLEQGDVASVISLLDSFPSFCPSPAAGLDVLLACRLVNARSTSDVTAIEEVDGVESKHSAGPGVSLIECFDALKAAGYTLLDRHVATLLNAAKKSEQELEQVSQLFAHVVKNSRELAIDDMAMEELARVHARYGRKELLPQFQQLMRDGAPLTGTTYFALASQCLDQNDVAAAQEVVQNALQHKVFPTSAQLAELRSKAVRCWAQNEPSAGVDVQATVDKLLQGTFNANMFISQHDAEAITDKIVKMKSESALRNLHSALYQMFLPMSASLLTKLYNTSIRLQSPDAALAFADEMTSRDMRLDSATIHDIARLLVKSDRWEDALAFVVDAAERMPLNIRAETLQPLLSYSDGKGGFRTPPDAIPRVERGALDANAGRMLNALMDYHMAADDVGKAQQLFTEIMEGKRHLVGKRLYYVDIVSRLLEQDCIEDGLLFQSVMVQYGFKPDSVVNLKLVEALCRAKRFDDVVAVVDKTLKQGFRVPDHVLNTAIVAMVNANDIARSERMFDKMLALDRTDVLPAFAALTEALIEREQFDRAHQYAQGVALIGRIKPRPELQGKLESLHKRIRKWQMKQIKAQNSKATPYVSMEEHVESKESFMKHLGAARSTSGASISSEPVFLVGTAQSSDSSTAVGKNAFVAQAPYPSTPTLSPTPSVSSSSPSSASASVSVSASSLSTRDLQASTLNQLLSHDNVSTLLPSVLAADGNVDACIRVYKKLKAPTPSLQAQLDESMALCFGRAGQLTRGVAFVCEGRSASTAAVLATPFLRGCTDHIGVYNALRELHSRGVALSRQHLLAALDVAMAQDSTRGVARVLAFAREHRIQVSFPLYQHVFEWCKTSSHAHFWRVLWSELAAADRFPRARLAPYQPPGLSTSGVGDYTRDFDLQTAEEEEEQEIDHGNIAGSGSGGGVENVSLETVDGGRRHDTSGEKNQPGMAHHEAVGDIAVFKIAQGLLHSDKSTTFREDVLSLSQHKIQAVCDALLSGKSAFTSRIQALRHLLSLLDTRSTTTGSSKRSAPATLHTATTATVWAAVLYAHVLRQLQRQNNAWSGLNLEPVLEEVRLMEASGMPTTRVLPQLLASLPLSRLRSVEATAAVKALVDMVSARGQPATAQTFEQLLSATPRNATKSFIRAIVEQALQSGTLPSARFYSKVIAAYRRGNHADALVTLLDTMEEQHVTPTLLTFRQLVPGLAYGGLLDKADECMDAMHKHGLQPTRDLLCLMAEQHFRGGELDKTFDYLGLLEIDGMELPGSLLSNIVVACAEHGFEDDVIAVGQLAAENSVTLTREAQAIVTNIQLVQAMMTTLQ
eukprot:m.40444 g.40444  ORF g.40444 m.40444 type:complete len:2063 (+) comp10439_c0_seq1:245-6433(+)